MSVEEPKKASVGKMIGCGCGIVALLAILGLGGCFMIFGKALKSNAPYTDSLAVVQKNAAAIEALGEPIKPGLIPMGNISVENNTGTVDFTIGVSGPKGKGNIIVKGTKAGGVWTYETWELQVDGQPDPIPLSK